jgi:hypothetical protein
MALVAFLVLIIVSFLVMVRANADSLNWLVAPMILLLISTSLNTWSLLIRAHETSAKTRHPKQYMGGRRSSIYTDASGNSSSQAVAEGEGNHLTSS